MKCKRVYYEDGMLNSGVTELEWKVLRYRQWAGIDCPSVHQSHFGCICHQLHSRAGSSPINGTDSHFISAGVGLNESHSH
jgi:hypothetical protein